MKKSSQKRIPPDVRLEAPIERWDEAVPLGNGKIGVLLWGGERVIRLSFDMPELWDTRQPDEIDSPDFSAARLAEWIEAERYDKITEQFESPSLKYPYPTKLTAARIELRLKSQRIASFSLNRESGEGTVDLIGGKSIRVTLPLGETSVLVRSEDVPFSIRIIPPLRANAKHGNGDMGCLTIDSLGYPTPRMGKTWMVQEIYNGQFAVAYQCQGNEMAVALSSDRSSALQKARSRTTELLGIGYEQTVKESKEWWRKHWGASLVKLPDPDLQEAYDFAQYAYGACSRRGSPPLALQGLWTADDGTLPPWRGDYHNDLNVQMSYWSALPANRVECDRAMLDFYWNLLPQHRELARRVWSAPGAWVPGVMSIDGNPIAAWAQYLISPTAGAWIATHFVRHWKLTGDREFLHDRVRPYCRAIGEFLAAVLKPGADGKLVIPFSASPEIHNADPSAWLTPNSNYDLSLIKALFQSLVQLDPRRSLWREVMNRLPEFSISAVSWSDWVTRDGVGPLMLSSDEELNESHRHHAHLMAIYPLGLLSPDHPNEKETIDQSLKQLERLGTMFWVGYSFAWAACLYARAGLAEAALHNLRVFWTSTCSRNGFHLNGDFKRTGATAWRYRPFTLEGNFAAAEAVHEMLLQSHGGIIRIFPAVPKKWTSVSFKNLRAEGGWSVSASLSDGRTDFIRIAAAGDGRRLKMLAPKKELKWNLKPTLKKPFLVFNIPAGVELIGTM